METSLKQQMIDALGLQESDFKVDGSDLMIRALPSVMPWLRQNFQYWTVVQSFRRRLRTDYCEPWYEGYYFVPREG